MKLRSILVPALLTAACTTDPSPELSSEENALTNVIPTSATCSQGVGASWCVEAPPFQVTATTQWTIDGARGATEYAGSTTLPYTVDDAGAAGAGVMPKIQGSGTVYLQRVTQTPRGLLPHQYLYVFLEDIPVRWGSTTGGQVEVYVDNDRFNSPDAFAHTTDRRYVINLATGTAVTVQQPTGSGVNTTWTAASLVAGTQFAAGGCTQVAGSPTIAKCKGELRIALNSSVTQAPAAGLSPGIGFLVRGSHEVGMSSDLATSLYSSAQNTINRWQTVLFSRPKGFPLSFTTWNIRRFEPTFQSAEFNAVDPKDIGKFLAKNDVVAIQEGWDRAQVQTLLTSANAARASSGLAAYNLYGPIDVEYDYSQVIKKIAQDVDDTQGGVWVMSALPLATFKYHVYTSGTCRGEDCLKAKGVLWVRLLLQDPAKYSPSCEKSPQPSGCGQPPSGDDFIDVFDTHLQANDPLLCKIDGEWAGYKALLLAGISALVDPVLAIELEAFSELVNADLNCSTQTDRQARAKQLAEMNTFITSVAATDRPSIVMGDFNLDGKLVTGSEYESALVALHIAQAATPDSDQVSALPPGLDVQHGDLVRNRTDVDFTTGRCIGTSIDTTGGTPDPGCTFAGGVDAATRIDYIFVRPPAFPTAITQDPRWIVEAVPATDIWTSPFPSLSGMFAATPLRLSDHKPVMSQLEFARLSNPPKYHPTWKHHVEHRIVHVDATDVDDCALCGQVDPFAALKQTIAPTSITWTQPHTTECTDNQNPGFPSDACMTNWGHTATHTPPNETSINLTAKVWDDDDTSGNDLLSEGTRSTFTYGVGSLDISHTDFGVEVTEPGTWWNSEAVPMSRCTGLGVKVCHFISLTPFDLGQ
jgi:endonuclease/exonuclease/phosphatase family metal-dependent hydrolase